MFTPLSERIVVDPKILAGKPVIRGTRLAVEFILEQLAAGQSESDILASYPGLTREDILDCLAARPTGVASSGAQNDTSAMTCPVPIKNLPG